MALVVFHYSLPMVRTTFYTFPAESIGLMKHSGFAYVGKDDALSATDISHAECKLMEINWHACSFPLKLPVFPSDNGVWLVQLTLTNTSTPSATNATFSIPGTTQSERRISVVTGNASSDGSVTTNFRFYGSLAAHVGSDGQLETLFTGLNVGEGVQALYWNDTSLGQSPIVLRNEAPSNPRNIT